MTTGQHAPAGPGRRLRLAAGAGRSRARGNRLSSRARQEFFRALFESDLVGVAITDPASRLWLDVNERLCRMFGYSRAELMQRSWVDLTHPDELPENLARFDELLSGKVGGYLLDKRFVHKDGGLVWTTVSVQGLRDRRGRLSHVVVLVHDISARKQAEQALRQSEERARAILAASPDPKVVYDNQGGVVYLNPAFTAVFGWSLEELAGRRVPFVPPDQMDITRRRIERILASGEPQVFETRRLTKDGRTLEVRINAAAIHDQAGQLSGMVVNITDLTVLKQAGNQMRQQKAYFEQLFECSPDAVAVIQQDGAIQRVNQAFTRLFGYGQPEIIGRNISSLLAPAERVQEAHDLRRRVAQGHVIEVETQRRAKDGRLVDVAITGAPIHLDAALIGILAVYRDIGARKRAEQALARSEELYRTLFEKAGDGIFLLEVEGDAAGRIVAANAAAAGLHGYSQAELLAMRIQDLETPEAAARAPELFRRILDGEWVKLETAHRRRDGGVFPVEASAGLVELAGEKYILAIDRDVTERKAAEAAIRQSEEKFAKAFMASPAWVAISTLEEGRYLDVNRAYLASTGYSRQEVIGRTTAEVGIWHDPAQRRQMVERLKRDGRVTGMEVQFRGKDGRLRQGVLSAELIELQGQVCLISVVMDITERRQAERELELIRFALYQAPVPFLLITPQGNFAYANPAACDHLGYTREQLLALRVQDIDPDYQDAQRDELWEWLRREKSFRLESRHLTKDGRLVPVEIFGHYLVWEGREYDCVFITDISQRKQAEAALKESEERFRILSEESPLGISLVGGDGAYEYVNPAFVKMFGWSLKDIRRGSDWFRLAYPDRAYRCEVVHAWKTDLKSSRAGDVRVRTFEVVCRDGAKKTVLFRPVLTESGRNFVIYEDITRQVTYQRALQESEKRYRELVDNISDFIYTHDLEGRFLSINRAAAQTLGFAPEELVGRCIADMMQPEYREAFRQEYLPRLERQGYDSGLSVYIDREGSKHYLEYKSQLVREDDRPPFVRGSARDVTERVLAAHEQRRLEEQLFQAQKMEALGTLTGGVAHDFNNLLTGIQGNLSLARQTLGPDHPGLRYLVNAALAAERAAKVTKQLLTLGRRAERHTRPLDLALLIDDTLHLLGETIDRRISLTMDLDPRLRLVEADEAQISQVIMNLCVNARDAIREAIACGRRPAPPAAPAEEGEWRILVSARNLDLDPAQAQGHALAYPGQFVVLSVADNGCGIVPETQERIFEPFFTTKPQGEGTGLGLATVYSIVKQHRGWITVDSTPGRGTSFAVHLPALTGAGPPQASPVAEEPLPRGSETVLVVDDEAMILDLVRDSLEGLGYRVACAHDGREALDIFDRFGDGIDLVILDMAMPGLSGQEILQRMLAKRPRTRVIISSGHTASNLTAPLGAAFLAKPYRIQDLAAAVRRALD
ncbi:MAG: PAS domain S-box protein [Thermodesulfobacteriota bacterium]